MADDTLSLVRGAVSQLVAGDMDEAAFMAVLTEARQTVDDAWRQYEAWPVYPEEITSSVLHGHDLLYQGLATWRDALDELARYFEDGDKNHLKRGVNMGMRANAFLTECIAHAHQIESNTAEAKSAVLANPTSLAAGREWERLSAEHGAGHVVDVDPAEVVYLENVWQESSWVAQQACASCGLDLPAEGHTVDLVRDTEGHPLDRLAGSCSECGEQFVFYFALADLVENLEDIGTA